MSASGSSAREQKTSRFWIRVALGSGGSNVPYVDPYVCRDADDGVQVAFASLVTVTSNALRK